MPDRTAVSPPAHTAVAEGRLERIDALRGVAVVWMTLFHACFDLSLFGLWPQNFLGDPFWLWQRAAIVALFIGCVGLGQGVASATSRRRSFWRRWAQIAGCAVLVSAGSYLVFPRSFIYFGVLHAVAVFLLVARASAAGGRGLWAAGAAVLLVHFAIQLIAGSPYSTWAAAHFFDISNRPPWNIAGLVSRKPVTEDFVPLVPWLAALWWGMAAAGWALRRRPRWIGGPVPSAARPLVWLGRHSLAWYMLHQPVLIGVLWVWTGRAPVQ